MAIGSEVDRFLNSVAGRYVLDRRDQTKRRLMEELSGPVDIKRLKEIHLELQIVEKTFEWFKEALDMHDLAYAELTQGQ